MSPTIPGGSIGAPIGAPASPPTMSRTLRIAASGLTAQRTRMEVIASNIANADTTRTAEGGPYRRRIAELGVARAEEFASELSSAQTSPAPAAMSAMAALAEPSASAHTSSVEVADAFGVRVRAIREVVGEGPRVYQPGHPDADGDGYVTYPNVRVTDEMVDLMDARRLFEANATVFQAAKSILRHSIDI